MGVAFNSLDIKGSIHFKCELLQLKDTFNYNLLHIQPDLK